MGKGYTIAYSYTEVGTVEIEASDLDEAEKQIKKLLGDEGTRGIDYLPIVIEDREIVTSLRD
ncbi:MAG: hypothetical protein KAJ07_00380 [Planctomycetes bacterium]|nr:hypothetical protein [Planctomycetota bacterium]